MCTNKACAARGPTIRRQIADVATQYAITYEELKDWAARSWNERTP